MNKRTIGTILVLVVLAGLMVVVVRSRLQTDVFDRQMAFETIEGEQVTLADVRGDYAIVNSWASWCPFCVDELPDLEQIATTFPDVQVIAISRDRNPDQARDFIAELGLGRTVQYLLDPRDRFYRAIGGFTMPETLFVLPDGTIFFHKRGVMNLDELTTRTEALLAN